MSARSSQNRRATSPSACSPARNSRVWTPALAGRPTEHEIDVLTVAQKSLTNIGTVKSRAALLDREVYRNLAGHAAALGVGDAIPWIMAGRDGVERSLLEAGPHVRVSRRKILYR